MRVKIWGARGSIPTPIRPEEVREKLVTAIMNISKLGHGKLRDELLAAILEEPRPAPEIGQSSLPEFDKAYVEAQIKRRQAIEAYLDSLSPLLTRTAGGNTPCIEIRTGSDLFIIDAGSGIRPLGQELMKGDWGRGKGVIHLFFSHPHWDHIQGFPFFRPAFIPGNKIFIYSVHDMEAALRLQQDSPSFPVSLDYMQAEMEFIRLQSEEVRNFGDLRISNIRNHHPGDAYSYRFEKGDKIFIYASDASYPTGVEMRPYLNFFTDADVLLYDAQFTQRESDEKEDWGHSSSLVGVEMAQQARVKNLVLYHYDPTYSDEDLEKILADTLKFQRHQYPDQAPVKITIAQEGQVFDLTPSDLIELQQVPGGKAAILKPRGIFDERVAAELKEQLADIEEFEWPPQLIIDMSEVEMLQVTGLRALVKLGKTQPGVMMVLAGPTINVQQVITLTGYQDFFAIYPSVHAALKSFQARKTLNLPGQLIKNRYYIEAKIGDGRLGTVFKAVDTRLNQPVAIKILSPSFSDGAIEQFLQQGRQIVDLDHPNIVNVYECDEDRGLSFMAEEFFENQTLRDMLSENPGQPLPFDVALSIAEKVADALEYSHAHGVTHGDLKPKNVLLADNVKISDFGLGRLESGKSLINLDVPLGLVSTHYVAPEQILGHPIDGRTDLYAFGVILYELFTGQRPFEGTDQEVLEHQRTSTPRPPQELNPALPPSLAHLILKLLDKDPNKRYATARQVRRILTGIITTTTGHWDPKFTRQHWPPLIDRIEPLDKLTTLWQKTRAGQGNLVFIAGQAGIGKTRLAQELARRANNFTLLMGHCQKTEGHKSYQPFIEALETYCACLPQFPEELTGTTPNLVGQVLIHLAKSIPDIRLFLPDIFQTIQPQSQSRPSSSAVAQVLDQPAEPTADHPIKFVSLAETIAQAAAERPWLLILDNLQWADPSSLKLLHYLARHCERMPLMIVGVYQDDALDENRFLVETLASLKQNIDYTTMTLTPLTERDVNRLLENIWSTRVPADLVAAIYRRTAGNPLHIEAIAKGLVDEGIVSRREGRWYFAPFVEGGLPQRIRDAVQRRLNRLTKKAQTLLNQAAILGPTFRFADLQAMSDLMEWDTLETLDIALERHLINQAANKNILCFSHIEIQEVLYNNLSPLKRRVMHLEAGEALERCHPEVTDVVEQLAYHFVQAKELEKGFRYSVQAARQAEVVYAHESALYWYTQALDALDRLNPDETDTQQRFELLLARERIYRNLGNRRAQAADLTVLQTLAQALDEPLKMAIFQSRQAGYERLMGNFAAALTLAEAGLAVARQAEAPEVEAECLIQLGRILADQGRFSPDCQPCRHLQMAQEILQKSDNPSSEAQSLNQLAIVYQYLGDYSQAQIYSQQAFTVSQAHNNLVEQAVSLTNLGSLALNGGNYVQAVTYFQQSLEFNRLIGNQQAQATCLNHLAATYKELGDLDTAQTYIQQACAIRYHLDDEQGEAEDFRILSAVYLAKGEQVVARDYAGQALEICQRLGRRTQEGQVWLQLGLALEALGDLKKARVAYEQAQLVQREIGNEAGDIEAQAGLTRCLLAEGQIEKAQKEAEAYLAWTKSYGTMGVKYPVRLYLTAYWVLQAANQKDEAITALQAGQALLEERINNIALPELRSLFNENVPENKELWTQLKLQTEKDAAL